VARPNNCSMLVIIRWQSGNILEMVQDRDDLGYRPYASNVSSSNFNEVHSSDYRLNLHEVAKISRCATDCFTRFLISQHKTSWYWRLMSLNITRIISDISMYYLGVLYIAHSGSRWPFTCKRCNAPCNLIRPNYCITDTYVRGWHSNWWSTCTCTHTDSASNY